MPRRTCRYAAEIVRRADRLTGLNASTGEPHREGFDLMIAADGDVRFVALLSNGGSTQLSTPDDKRVVQQSALTQIVDESGRRLIRQLALMRQAACDGGVRPSLR